MHQNWNGICLQFFSFCLYFYGAWTPNLKLSLHDNKKWDKTSWSRKSISTTSCLNGIKETLCDFGTWWEEWILPVSAEISLCASLLNFADVFTDTVLCVFDWEASSAKASLGSVS